MADTTIVTGQYVRISQTSASLGERLLARMIDTVIIILYVIATLTVIYSLPYSARSGWTFYIVLLALYLPVWLYSLLFEVFNQGQTPGKRLMNIKVVMKDGSTPSLSGYLLRWLLYPIDVTISGGVGVIFVLLTKNNQRIGDLAAGTMVIRMNNYRRVKVSLDEYKHLTEGYSPVYPQVSDLSFEQFSIINKALALDDRNGTTYRNQLSNKLKEMLKLNNVKEDDKSFLQTVKRDYEYYAYVEI